MIQEGIPHEARFTEAPTESAGDTRRYRKRRRVQLRHETAVVAAEIRRMRRAHWSITGGDLPARLVS